MDFNGVTHAYLCQAKQWILMESLMHTYVEQNNGF